MQDTMKPGTINVPTVPFNRGQLRLTCAILRGVRPLMGKEHHRMLCSSFADALEPTNDKFDRNKFLTDSGV